MRAIPLCNWEPGLWEGSGRESSLAHPRRARGIVEQGELRRALALRRRGELLLGCGGGKVSRAVRLCQTTAACGADVSPVPSPTPKTETRAQPEHWFRRPRGQRRMDTNVHFDRGPGPMYIYVTSATLPAVRPQPPFFPPVGEADSMFDSGQGAGQTAVHAGRVGRAGQGRAMGWARTQLKSRGGATAAAVACGRPDRRVRKESQA